VQNAAKTAAGDTERKLFIISYIIRVYSRGAFFSGQFEGPNW